MKKLICLFLFLVSICANALTVIYKETVPGGAIIHALQPLLLTDAGGVVPTTQKLTGNDTLFTQYTIPTYNGSGTIFAKEPMNSFSPIGTAQIKNGNLSQIDTQFAPFNSLPFIYSSGIIGAEIRFYAGAEQSNQKTAREVGAIIAITQATKNQIQIVGSGACQASSSPCIFTESNVDTVEVVLYNNINSK